MDVMEAIYSRRSVRDYTNQPVDKSTVEALIKAATHALSSMNKQPWVFAVIQNLTQLAAWSDRIKAYVPVFPVVVGYPSGETPPVQRRTPKTILWQ